MKDTKEMFLEKEVMEKVERPESLPEDVRGRTPNHDLVVLSETSTYAGQLVFLGKHSMLLVDLYS